MKATTRTPRHWRQYKGLDPQWFNDLPTFLVSLREDLNLTQAEMAKHIGISTRQYNKYESPNAPTPSPKVLAMMLMAVLYLTAYLEDHHG